MTSLATVKALVCAKCLGDDILTRFHKQGCGNTNCSCATCTYGSHVKEHEEHLHYICQTCGYDWIGTPADA